MQRSFPSCYSNTLEVISFVHRRGNIAEWSKASALEPETWAQILTLPLISHGTFDKSVNLSVLWFIFKMEK